MSEAVRGLIVAHSSLATGLVAAVQQIAGVGDEALQALSNEGHGPEGLIAAVRSAVAIGAKVVWMQEGIENEEAAAKARAAGLEVVMDRCILKEHRKVR